MSFNILYFYLADRDDRRIDNILNNSKDEDLCDSSEVIDIINGNMRSDLEEQIKQELKKYIENNKLNCSIDSSGGYDYASLSIEIPIKELLKVNPNISEIK